MYVICNPFHKVYRLISDHKMWVVLNLQFVRGGQETWSGSMGCIVMMGLVKGCSPLRPGDIYLRRRYVVVVVVVVCMVERIRANFILSTF